MSEFTIAKLAPREPIAERVRQFILALPLDKAWRISFSEHRRQRSDDQNEALWGLAYKILSQETGNDPEDLHVYFCGEFFGWDEYEVMGQPRKRPVRTTTKNHLGKRDVISTLEFSGFFDFVQRRSAETVGVYIPDPDPSYRDGLDSPPTRAFVDKCPTCKSERGYCSCEIAWND